ncbi:MAG: flagellar motor switch protein FliG [Thalassovita sp.]
MTSLTPIAQIDPVAAPSSGSPRLSRRQKAAIIVRFLLNEGADLNFTELPEDLQTNLTQQMGEMRLVDRTTLAHVLSEFADELEQIGVTFPHDLSGALAVLEGRLDPRTAAKLRKQAGVRQYKDPWDRIGALDASNLVPIFETESTEIAAVILSKLDVARAAEVLALLPGPRARQITFAVAQTKNVTPDAVDRIGLSLASQLDARPDRAFDDDPEERVGAILNFSPSATREELLNGLGEEDAEFADRVRKSIFTFANIPARVATLDVPKIIKAADQDQLIQGLAAAQQGEHATVAEFFLSNMSSRMAASIREEIEETGKFRPKEAEDAMAEITAVIRNLQQNGTLTFLSADEGEED